MRFLVDASLSPAVARGLNDAGHDAVHVGDVMSLDAVDDAVFDRAVDEERIIVAADTDFAELLALRESSRPSLILFRRRTGRRPSDAVTLLLSHLDDVEYDLVEGAVVVIEQARIRVRRLPIGPD